VVIGLGLHHFMQTAQMRGVTAGDAFEQQPRNFSLTVKLGLRRPQLSLSLKMHDFSLPADAFQISFFYPQKYSRPLLFYFSTNMDNNSWFQVQSPLTFLIKPFRIA
jgi:hypothetical protein